ncbi:MAG TPA: Gfo/Idh/MocA family oxidoreductase [Polyangiaceae bacterium]
MSGKLRIGVLGAARIVPTALLAPARVVEDVEIASIAARDPERARRFARRHGIAGVAESYEALVSDPSLHAIYNPLPNTLHALWSIRALEAGKHLLCEKPFTSNEAEARLVADAAKRSGRVAMEAFHWRYHPLADRMRAVVASGELGRVKRIERAMCVPLPLPGNIRYRLELGGGAAMDTGCYAVSMMRHLASAEPRVGRVEVRLSSPDVDRWMRAEVAFDDGRTGRVICSIFSATLLSIRARVEGEDGTMDVLNPIAPHVVTNRLTLTTKSGRRSEKVPGEPTYTGQLRAFAGAVLRGEPVPTDAEDAVKNMRVIDDLYRGAGLPLRGT